jgi:hypothetical protein
MECFEFAGCFLKPLVITLLVRIGVFVLIVGGGRGFG